MIRAEAIPRVRLHSVENGQCGRHGSCITIVREGREAGETVAPSVAGIANCDGSLILRLEESW